MSKHLLLEVDDNIRNTNVFTQQLGDTDVFKEVVIPQGGDIDVFTPPLGDNNVFKEILTKRQIGDQHPSSNGFD